MFPDIKFPMNKTDWIIREFAKKDKPTVANFMRLKNVGGLYDAVDRYRLKGASMTEDQLKAEKRSSRRLGLNMLGTGDPRPSDRCDAHAIISGGHELSIGLRGMLAWASMRVDDPHNGC